MMWHFPLHLRIILPVAFIAFATAAGLFVTVMDLDMAKQRIERDGQITVAFLMTQLQGEINSRIAEKGLIARQDEITRFSTIPQIKVLLLADENGRVLAANRYAWQSMQAAKISHFDPQESKLALSMQKGARKLLKDDTLIQGYYPVMLGYTRGELRPDRFGTLYVEYDLSSLRDEARRTAVKQATGFWLIVASLALALFLLIHLRITKRVEKMAYALSRFAAGDMNSRAALAGDDEIAYLAHGFNDMAQKLGMKREVLKESEAFLSSIIENIPDMIFTKDAKELRFVRFNKAGEELLGYKREVLIGKNDYDFFPKEQADFFTKKDRAVLESGKLYDIPEEPINTKTGIRILHTKKLPILDRNGNPAYLLGISEDITERRRAEKELFALKDELEIRVKERTAQLEASNKELESFSYSVSHDLRVPLRAIDGFSSILLDEYQDKFDAEGKRLLNVVRNNTKRMAQLIDDILAFSRTGSMEMTPAEINMEDLAHDVVDEFNPAFAGREVKIKIKPLPPVHADRAMMRQVFVNLLSNAVKFTRQKTVAQIEVGADSGEKEVIYYVRDNGVGFDMQYVGKLFGMFMRLHGVDEFEGTGIGLAIVKRIINRHGGKIWAEGKINGGATVYFALPIKGENHG